MKTLIALTLTFGSTVWAVEVDFPVKPDEKVTYGDFCDPYNPDFQGYRYEGQVAYCVRNVTTSQKTRIYNEYQIPEKCRGEYTIDHYVPLAMGGSNEDSNLWPEHRHVKATRQNLEQELFDELKNGRISQDEAVEIVTTAKLNPPTQEIKPSNCQNR